jgi:death-on-curing protein
VKYPTIEQIIQANYRHLSESGHFFIPPDNLKERGTLEWVLDAIQYPLFGVDQYPTFIDKASILTWKIIRGHVFWDGNKRTGMTILHYFCRINTFYLNVKYPENRDAALLIADASEENKYSEVELTSWIRERLEIMHSL